MNPLPCPIVPDAPLFCDPTPTVSASRRETGGRYAIMLRRAAAVAATTAAALLAGCATPYQTGALAAGGAIAVVSGMPVQELEQVYYLGVFDPEEQLPPTVYRLTVHGQASVVSSTRFASGWVPAGVIDSLTGQASLDANGTAPVEINAGNTNYTSTFTTGRRLMLFGPEGFREAPANHRLVIVMGASPKNFFERVDEAIGQVSGAAVMQNNAALEKKLFEALITTKSSLGALDRLKSDIADALPQSSK